MKLVSLILVLGVLAGIVKGAEFMVVDGGQLTPSTTLEVRFDAAMVGADEVGVTVTGDAVPVVVAPGLDGSFTWLSTRSGVLVPGKVPALGTRYRVAVKGGLKGADGAAVNERAEVVLLTPEFGVADTSISRGVNARVRVAFNREVVLESLEGKVRFVNSEGGALEAAISKPERWNYIDGEAEDWEWRWEVARKGRGIADKPTGNRVEIRPVGMLTPGGEWSVEIGAGVKSVRGDSVSAITWTKTLGEVEPMVVEQVTPISYVNSGRSVTVRFSRSPGPDVTAETAGQFVRVEPAVEGGLRFEEGWKTLVLRGAFELGVDYRVVVDPSLLAESGLAVSGELSKPFRFKPIEPRVYLPEITGHQIRGGQRKLPVVSVNLRSMRVVARRVAAEDVPAAVEAFENYHKEWDRDQPDEDYQALDPAAIRGELLYDEVVVPGGEAGEIDGRQTTVLEWDEVLGDGAAGTVFITVEGEPMSGATAQRVGAQALLQLTDLGVLWKKYGERLWVTVFSMASGKPVAGVDVGLLDVGMERLRGGESGADGTLWLDLGPREPGWLTVGKGDDVHALRMGEKARKLPTAAFGLPTEWVSWDPEEVEEPEARVTLFTDRPLYRPGESVKVKGIVRRVEDGVLDYEAGRQGKLRLRLPQDMGEKVIDVRTDARGAFDVEVELDPVKVGQYSLGVSFEGLDLAWRGRSVSILAADFQPNAFDVAVETPERGVGGDGFQAGVKGTYFFGSPTAGAKVVWTLQGGPSWFAGNGWWDFRFGGEEDREKQKVTLRGEGTLASGGGMAIEPELPEVSGGPWEGALTVEVTDENQQTVSASRSFTVEASEFYLGIADLERSVVGSGEEFEVKVVAVNGITERPVDSPVELSAELVTRRFETVRVKGAGNAISFRTETIDEVVATAKGRTLEPEWDGDRWLVGDGASVVFAPEEAGSYLVRVKAEDGAGRVTEAVSYFDVGGNDAEISWDYRHPAQVVMMPDKKDYVVGETAKILVKTPFGGEAVVSVERGKQLLRSQRVVLEGNAPVIEIPLEEGDGPNVFVSMVLVRGADESTRKFPVPEYRYGLCQLRLVDVASKLAVRVFPRRAEVEPGEDVEVEVRVRDGNGEPLVDAEVTLFAVDDGILAITGYSRPEPWGNFHRPVPLGVAMGLTLYELMEEDPAALKYGNKGYLIGGGGLGGAGTKLRRNFPGTVAWYPSLRTDEGGRVTVKFTAPDALTRYRIVAVANEGAGGFGAAESSFQIRKRLMVLSGLGQGGKVGDELVARAVVVNESGAAGKVNVALVLDSTAEAAGERLSAVLELADGESGTVDLPVRLLQMGEAEWQWSATMGEGKNALVDRVEAKLKIGSPAPVLRETYLSELGEKRNDLLSGVNPQLVEGDGSVRVTVSNTRLAGLRGAADELLTYPYGCAEQTVSSMVPWIVVRKLGPVLPGVAASEEAVRAAIGHGVAKLMTMQVGSGGIGYWPNARRASLFASGWAGVALALLEHSGEPMPAGADKLYEYLSEAMRGAGARHRYGQLDDQVLAAFALAIAKRGEAGYHEVLYSKRESMSHETRELLALAVLATGGSKRVVNELLDERRKAPPGTSWYGGVGRERAVRLMAVSQARPQDKEVGTLVAELLQSRSGRTGAWRTTQENAWALLALSDYFSRMEGGQVLPVSGEIVHGKGNVGFGLTEEVLTDSLELEFDRLDPLERLEVANPEEGRLYGEARFEVRPVVEAQPAQDRGYAVARQYQELGADGELREVDDLQVGDRVLVTLRVTTDRPGHFVAIDDPLPAVLEAVNPDFNTAQVGGERPADRSWAADYREIRSDRVVYFCDHLGAGTYTFRYLARVRSAGTVAAPSVKVEEMYRPERFGLSESATMTSRGL